MKKLLTLLTLVVCVCTGAWAADAVSATRTYSNENTTCTWTITAATVSKNVTTPFGADGILFTTIDEDNAKISIGDNNSNLKLNNYGNAMYVEVPSATSTGTITLKAPGNQAHRNVKLNSGALLPMNTSGTTKNFASGDIVTIDDKYYIQLVNTNDEETGASADYKVVLTDGISVTLTNGTYAVTTPTITLDKTSAIVRATANATPATATIKVTASNLTASGTLTASISPTVNGLSVSPSDISIAADGSISSTDVTVSFTATENVTSGSATLTLSDKTTSVSVPIYYSAVITPWTLQSISNSTTWTFDDANIPSGSLNLNTSAIYANIAGMAFGSDFNATALELGSATWPYYSNGKIAQSKTFKFNTTVPGSVKVTYNKASGDAVYISVNNGDNGSASTTTTTEAIVVSAGDVTIKGYSDEEHETEALLNVSKIEFTATIFPTAIELNKATTTIEVSGSETLTVTATPEGASNLVTWTSSDENIATVSDAGLVTAVAEGEATITATSILDNTVKATCTVTVEAIQTPIVNMPEDGAKNGYESSLASSDISSSDFAMNGRTVYSVSNGATFTITIPATTMVSKIKVIGTSADNSNASTVTITGVAGDYKAQVMNTRKAENATEFVFVPATQTTTYTIQSSNKGSYLQIVIYGEELVLTPKKQYTTLTSAYNLDFTNVEGLNAYIVKPEGVSESAVTLTQVNKVPAGTGLVLKGTPNTKYTLETYEGDGDDVTGNKMVGSATDETTPVTDAAYILSNGAFHPWSGEGKIAAGKAYLNASVVTGGAKALIINFADETGISNADAEVTNTGTGKRYNLNGQLVGEDYKGIVIIDGQKFNQ